MAKPKQETKSWQNVTNSKKDDDFDLFDRTAEFMKQFEGYTPVAKWDYKQWSIWYGTKSYQWETITQEEALERYKEEIKQAYNRCRIERFANNKNLQVALISFCYNVGHLPANTERYVNNGYLNALKNQMKRYVYAWSWTEKKVMKGLVKRRNAETQLF